VFNRVSGATRQWRRVFSKRHRHCRGVGSRAAAGEKLETAGSGSASSPLPFLAGGDLYKQQKTQPADLFSPDPFSDFFLFRSVNLCLLSSSQRAVPSSCWWRSGGAVVRGSWSCSWDGEGCPIFTPLGRSGGCRCWCWCWCCCWGKEMLEAAVMVFGYGRRGWCWVQPREGSGWLLQQGTRNPCVASDFGSQKSQWQGGGQKWRDAMCGVYWPGLRGILVRGCGCVLVCEGDNSGEGGGSRVEKIRFF